MIGNYFYHEIIKKTVIAFGTLFNRIEIHRKDDTHGNDISIIRVPIAYGPIQKFLARIEQQPEFNKEVAITLPRLAFEITSYRYDSSRKASPVTKFCAASDANGTKLKRMFMPVPYDIGFRLSFACKLNEDALQILEQILPIFQPQYSLTINYISEINEKRDIPFILNNVSFIDEYEGNFDTRRYIQYDLDFTAKTYFYNELPTDENGGLIKKVQVDYTTVQGSSRQVRYTVTPKATVDYTNDATASLTETFLINKTLMKVTGTTSFSVGEYIQVGKETMRIKEIDGNNMVVSRGEYGTDIIEHFTNDVVNAITIADDALINVEEDDFGFNELVTDFTDFKSFSDSIGSDV